MARHVQISDHCRIDQSACRSDLVSVTVPTTVAAADPSVELDLGGFVGKHRRFRLMLLRSLTFEGVALLNFNSFSPDPRLNGMLLANGANLTLRNTLIKQVCPVVASLCAQQVVSRVRSIFAEPAVQGLSSTL